jgi:hypothetical protein
VENIANQYVTQSIFKVEKHHFEFGGTFCEGVKNGIVKKHFDTPRS